MIAKNGDLIEMGGILQENYEDVNCENTVNLLVEREMELYMCHTLEDPDKLRDCNRYKERESLTKRLPPGQPFSSGKFPY